MNNAFQTDTVEINNVSIRIEYFYDDEYRPKPWAEYDGNVNIYEKSTRYGKPEKRPSEMIFYAGRGHDAWAYDIREAHKKALEEGWCTGCDWAQGLTRKQIAARAVAENVEMWRSWLNDEWHYVGVTCTVLDAEGEETDDSESCWGFETLNDYHETAAQDMAQGLADSVNERKREAWRSALHEARECKYWALRDVATTGALL